MEDLVAIPALLKNLYLISTYLDFPVYNNWSLWLELNIKKFAGMTNNVIKIIPNLLYRLASVSEPSWRVEKKQMTDSYCMRGRYYGSNYLFLN
jgi:hypothetical protein